MTVITDMWSSPVQALAMSIAMRMTSLMATEGMSRRHTWQGAVPVDLQSVSFSSPSLVHGHAVASDRRRKSRQSKLP